jgi:uncharacterized membrane protein YtjA (UPF0391 family)
MDGQQAMVIWTLCFFIAALLCAAVGFTEVFMMNVAKVARIFFFVFLILFLLTLIPVVF